MPISLASKSRETGNFKHPGPKSRSLQCEGVFGKDFKGSNCTGTGGTSFRECIETALALRPNIRLNFRQASSNLYLQHRPYNSSQISSFRVRSAMVGSPQAPHCSPTYRDHVSPYTRKHPGAYFHIFSGPGRHNAGPVERGPVRPVNQSVVTGILTCRHK